MLSIDRQPQIHLDAATKMLPATAPSLLERAWYNSLAACSIDTIKSEIVTAESPATHAVTHHEQQPNDIEAAAAAAMQFMHSQFIAQELAAKPDASSLSFLLNADSAPSAPPKQLAMAARPATSRTAPGPTTSNGSSPNELELLQRFLEMRMIAHALKKPGSRRGKHRRPSTIESLLRRWFAGRQTTAAAAGRAEVLNGVLDDVGNQQELIGTAALLELGRSGAHHHLVRVGTVVRPNEYTKVEFFVQALKRGRPKKNVSVESRRQFAGYRTSRMYFVHPTIVLACERYTRSFQQRSGLTSLIPGGAPL